MKTPCIGVKLYGGNGMEQCFQGEKEMMRNICFLKEELLYIFEQMIEGFK